MKEELCYDQNRDLSKRDTDGQQACEKMLAILSYHIGCYFTHLAPTGMAKLKKTVSNECW